MTAFHGNLVLIDYWTAYERRIPPDGGTCFFHRLPRWLQRALIKAAPSCTLWRSEFNRDVMVFRPWPALYFTGYDQVMLS